MPAAEPAASPASRCGLGLGHGGLVRTCPGSVAWWALPGRERERAAGGERLPASGASGFLLTNGSFHPGRARGSPVLAIDVEPRG
ncbi:hypothetical protein H671_4g11607 [Cricetulus griseus]|uniref:Uncharacterized protein n=1 Tax=Cricetulus griseus TaxID=10029 RepID=A0A061I4X8_CRIGR|nr:hypothetical protein H671_4g11607 [Cricetulus griseus]